MIPLKKAVEIYNSPKSAEFWNFLAEEVLQIEKNGYVPDFVKEIFITEVSKVKAKLITEQMQKDTLLSKIKQMLKTKKIKYSTICLIRYTLPRRHKKVSEIVLKKEDITIKIQGEFDSFFDFRCHNPFYKLKFNPKTRSIMLKTLGSCKKADEGRGWYKVSKLSVTLEVMNYDVLLVLMFRYNVERKSGGYGRFSSKSNYAVVKIFYIIKNPFYLIESKERFLYYPSEHSPETDLKEILKKFTPKYEKDKPVFKELRFFLKKKKPVLLSKEVKSI
ncbi:MAG: hypothetical protein QW735_03255 [archaeon]